MLSDRAVNEYDQDGDYVLILVVMEDALWLYFSLFIEYQYFEGDKRSKNDSY